MNVIGCVENPSGNRAAEMATKGIRLVPTDQVLAESDFLSVHVPLKDSTRGVIDADAIGRMKPGVFLINMSRGGVVREAALLDALNAGHVAGAGVDVHEREGDAAISPLAELDNVILTPHMGAGTVDSQRLIGDRVLEIVREHSLIVADD